MTDMMSVSEVRPSIRQSTQYDNMFFAQLTAHLIEECTPANMVC